MIRSEELREFGLLKYYRLIRKWAAKSYGIQESDLELMIYLDALNTFTLEEFTKGTSIYSWDKHRWRRLRKEGWIDVWRQRNRIEYKYSIFKLSIKAKIMISRIYKILANEEQLPTGRRNVFYKNKSYTDKVFNKAMDDMLNDLNR